MRDFGLRPRFVEILVSREMETCPRCCRNIGWILYGTAALVALILRRAALTPSAVKPCHTAGKTALKKDRYICVEN